MILDQENNRNMYKASVILDSVSRHGHRLTTLELTYPRIILAEVDTHRMLSRNSASSRAIPIEKIMEQVRERPFIPDRFPVNGPGMQPCAYARIDGEYDIIDAAAFEANKRRFTYDGAMENWVGASQSALAEAEAMHRMGIHKEIVNRILEPWQWTTTVISATDFWNVWAQRCHSAAQAQFQKIATMAYKAWQASTPRLLDFGEWHLPYLDDDDRENLDLEAAKMVSSARCAAVSYHRQGEARDYEVLIGVFKRLTGGADGTMPGHWSPLEHVARPLEVDRDPYLREVNALGQQGDCFSGNYRGWYQYRKEFGLENWTEEPLWLNTVA